MGTYGFDSVILGRKIPEIDDIARFVKGVHEFEGYPRSAGMGMKSSPYFPNPMFDNKN